MVQLSFMDAHLTDPLANVIVRQQNVADKSWRRLGNGYCTWEVFRDDGVVRVESQNEPKRTILETRILARHRWLKPTETLIQIDGDGVLEPHTQIEFEDSRKCAVAWGFVSQILYVTEIEKKPEFAGRSSQVSPTNPGLQPFSSYNQKTMSSAKVTNPVKRDKFGGTSLSRACSEGDVEKVKIGYLRHPDDLNQPDDGGMTPLHLATNAGSVEIVRFLLEKGACYEPLHEGAIQGRVLA